MTHVFLKNSFFAPPKFLTMPAIGIDISDRSIKYAELFAFGDGYKLGRYGSIPLTSGIVEDGKVINQSELAKALCVLRIEHNISFVRTVIREEQVYFFRARFPRGSREALYSAIELSLEEHVPIPATDAVFDFEIVDPSYLSTDVDVAVTVVTKSVVDGYVNAFRLSGLTLLSLELEANAIARSVVNNDDKTAHLLVDFGEARTGITIVYGGSVYMASTVNVGGKILTDTIAKHLNISVSEAERLKREFGLQKNSQHEEIFAILLTNIALLRDEINKTLIYWHTHPDENGNVRPEINKILLLGGDSNLPGLPEYLAASLRVETEIANVWTNIVLPKRGVPDLSKSESLGYATSIGLALYKENYE